MEVGSLSEWAWLELASLEWKMGRPLRLYAFARDSMTPKMMERAIDVDERGVDGRSSLYHLSDKACTGISFDVQGVVATQLITVKVLNEAASQIEREGLEEFAFVCHGGTHRSVACCMLLAMIVYREAVIHLSTPRTNHAADLAGMC